jgi:hypothetical protein
LENVSALPYLPFVVQAGVAIVPVRPVRHHRLRRACEGLMVVRYFRTRDHMTDIAVQEQEALEAGVQAVIYGLPNLPADAIYPTTFVDAGGQPLHGAKSLRAAARRNACWRLGVIANHQSPNPRLGSGWPAILPTVDNGRRGVAGLLMPLRNCI